MNINIHKMNNFKCTRIIEFDAAHRVVNHGGKCKFLHGHRYVLEVTIASKILTSLGMVIDFGELKSIIKGWIDNNLDHNVILHNVDKNIGDVIEQSTNQKIYYMDRNPTAENIAIHLKFDIIPKLLEEYTDIFVEKIKLFETPNCFVEV
jgi:6-pyruvoyltetrahydropterin/6-carboxytetrahydropterin synthase